MKTLTHLFALALGLGATSLASAGVIQGFGANAVDVRTNFASFDANLALANDYVEDGLLFHFSGSGANNGCGYAGVDCYDDPAELGAGFAGNYMASAGSNAYVSVRRVDGSTFHAIEWAAGTGYLALNGYWQTLDDGAITGAGNFSAVGGSVLALADWKGFDEVRYFAFAAPNKQAGFSSPAIDSVSVGEVPEPGGLLLAGAALAGLGCARRRRISAPA